MGWDRIKNLKLISFLIHQQKSKVQKSHKLFFTFKILIYSFFVYKFLQQFLNKKTKTKQSKELNFNLNESKNKKYYGSLNDDEEESIIGGESLDKKFE